MRFQPRPVETQMKVIHDDDDEIVTLAELVPQSTDDDEHDWDLYSCRCRRCGCTAQDLMENDGRRCIPF